MKRTLREDEIRIQQIDDENYAVLHKNNEVTPYVAHFWNELTGYFWGWYVLKSGDEAHTLAAAHKTFEDKVRYHNKTPTYIYGDD